MFWKAELNSCTSFTDSNSPLKHISPGSCSTNSWKQTNIDLIPKVTTVSVVSFPWPISSLCNSDKIEEELSSWEQNYATVFWHPPWFSLSTSLISKWCINISHPAAAASESEIKTATKQGDKRSNLDQTDSKVFFVTEKNSLIVCDHLSFFFLFLWWWQTGGNSESCKTQILGLTPRVTGLNYLACVHVRSFLVLKNLFKFSKASFHQLFQ